MPQQNAMAERKHRHVLEIARSLRFHAGLPLNLWGACVMTSVHIINRLPIPVLDNCTSCEKLYKEIPTYDHMRVCGCLSFASNPSIPSDKFSHRGIPTVFIGYPPLKKSYKLLNLLKKTEFISRDVTFQENIFPFHKNVVNSYTNPIPPSFIPPAPVVIDDDWLSIPTETTSPEPTSFSSDYDDDDVVSDTFGIPTPNSQTPASTSPTPPPVIRKFTRPTRTPAWLKDFVLPNHTSSISNLATTVV